MDIWRTMPICVGGHEASTFCAFRIIAEEEECSSDSIKRKYRRIRDEIKEEIIECLEMNCRGGKQDECHIC